MPARIALEPLSEDHADEMAVALADPRLYVYTGGRPMSADELRIRYRRQIAGPADDSGERWHNWIVRRLADDVAIGYVQATVMGSTPLEADIAWVIGTSWQSHGYATEAALAMIELLKVSGIRRLNAHILPDNLASAKVATHLGLVQTTEIDDEGEVIWRRDVVRPIGGASRLRTKTA